jgi:hypothetical protein
MVIEEGNSASDAVIVVEPIRQSTHATTEEMRAATRNTGSGFREWAAEEGAWLLVQLAKTAVSVAVFRVVHQLFRAKITSESVYRRAAQGLAAMGRERLAAGVSLFRRGLLLLPGQCRWRRRRNFCRQDGSGTGAPTKLDSFGASSRRELYRRLHFRFADTFERAPTASSGSTDAPR